MSFTAPHVDWAAIAPVAVVLVAAVVGVLLEAFVPARVRRTTQVAVAFAALAGALLAVALLWPSVRDDGGRDVIGGSLAVDGVTLVVQATILVLSIVALLVIADRTSTGLDAFAPSAASIPGSDYEALARTKGLQQTELYPLLLFAVGGMLVFPATSDLLVLFVALEVLSLPLYLMTGMARRRRLLSQEASLKYFLLGAFASALLLFGIALLYGYSGSLKLSEISAATQQVTGTESLLLVGAVLVMAGLLFKVGAVPFQAWTPDVYQGAPTPITAFMSACTKIAAFGALLRFVYVGLPGMQWDLQVVLWTVAIATMVVGTVVALVQTDIKRVLGYSAVAHTGFILTGVVALNEQGLHGTLFYLLAYGAASVGAFAVVWLVRERSVGADGGEGDVLGEATHLSQWAGLGRRHPVLAGVFTLFLLSFAGIPLTAGFIGKFSVFSAAVEGGAWPLALVGVLSSAAAVFFYVRIVVLMYFTEPAVPGAPEQDGGTAAVEQAPVEQAPVEAAPVEASGATAATLTAERTATGERTVTTTVVRGRGVVAAVTVCAVLTVLLGVAPQPVLDAIASIATFLP
ncbi:NADH-quinone oxidoreductase subunit NuoN [Cellulomonas massiliensis]|uniref:NADH-quinone oxidoreductase subunit NuoN n=1 Tax=Cellulomonas massiliensis TaxID=1465811 RepID=UPI0002FACD33|nr:NADH-quinone oxidoreductase subunit NuoN [Cellulomonas massiliensis]